MLKKLITLAAVAALAISQVGCTSQQTISELTATLGNAAASLAALEGNVGLATQLKTDTATAVGLIAQWKSGSPTQDVVEALNIVEDDLNLIPGTSQYAAFVDLGIGTVEEIIALLPTPAAAPAPAVSLAARTAKPHRKVTLQKPPTTSGEFKKQWNAIAAVNPQLSVPKL